jgi:CTP synthase (UTP-ammonia lyase)
MLGDLLQNRVEASAEWDKMQDAMAHIRKTGVQPTAKATPRKQEKKEPAKVATAPVVKEVPVEITVEAPVKEKTVAAPIVAEPKTLDQKVLEYINKHPKGVKISEMEEPLAETRMKLGYTAKALLDQGKIQKVDNIYFPLK